MIQSGLIDIVSFKGERYSFDPDTGRIFKNGKVLVSEFVEPVYSYMGNPGNPPTFSGIYFKDKNQILSLSGKLNPVVKDDNEVK